jgi:glycosyltransferase involved in cell wall biosynthesis
MIETLVVIPCFNGEATLARAVESVLVQGCPDVRIALVDDGSTDGSLALAQSLAQSHKEVVSLSMPANGGPAAARNLGARSQDSRFIAFLDADDEWLPGYLPVALHHLKEDEEIDAVKVAIEIFPPLAIDPARLDLTFRSIPSNLLIHRYVFDFLGGFPEDTAFRTKLAGEDVAFQTAMFTHFNVLGVKEALLRHHCPPDSHLHRFLAETKIENGQTVFPDTPERREVGLALGRYLTQVRNRARAALKVYKPGRP